MKKSKKPRHTEAQKDLVYSVLDAGGTSAQAAAAAGVSLTTAWLWGQKRRASRQRTETLTGDAPRLLAHGRELYEMLHKIYGPKSEEAG